MCKSHIIVQRYNQMYMILYVTSKVIALFRPLGGRETRSCTSLLRPFQKGLEMIPQERLAPKKVISSEMEAREMHLIFTWRRA